MERRKSIFFFLILGYKANMSIDESAYSRVKTCNKNVPTQAIPVTPSESENRLQASFRLVDFVTIILTFRARTRQSSYYVFAYVFYTI